MISNKPKINIVGADVIYKSTINSLRLINITYYYNHSNGHTKDNYIKKTTTEDEFNAIANDLTLLHDTIEAWHKENIEKEKLIRTQNLYYQALLDSPSIRDKNESYLNTTVPTKVIFTQAEDFEIPQELKND